MEENLRLGSQVRFPITIIKLLKPRGAIVKKGEAALQYSYKWTQTYEDPTTHEEKSEERTSIVDWDCPTEGNIKRWRIKEGEVIAVDREIVIVEEVCPHSIQFQGICGMCGKDMTEVNFATDTLDTQRAPINMTHDQTSLTVSKAQAQRAEHDLQRRLLRQKKLSLVVDLDQTVIHACIDPTVGEWQSDAKNPNYEAVKDVQSFQLNDDGPRGLTSGCWYYIKMRPGLSEFLDKISQLYELHVYTMGTRAYAQHIANIIDPEKKLFGNRVISRDENGSMTAKSLQRIFPVSTDMVVIIDDRADVWPHNKSNLIKVVPYDFFKGVGDINSSFLPKREAELGVSNDSSNGDGKVQQAEEALAAAQDGKSPSGTNGTPEAIANGETELLKLQAEEQERTLEKQLTERPLQHMQAELDKEDEATQLGKGSEEAPAPQQRHHLLLDNDNELTHLAKHLTAAHAAFFQEYETSHAQGRKTIPDVGRILDEQKAEVLTGTKIALSGLVPLGMSHYASDIGTQVMTFGATLETQITPDITHLVVSSQHPRTEKVRKAATIPTIEIVNERWLADSISQWIQLDEANYRIEVHPKDRKPRSLDLSAVKAGAVATADVVNDADAEDEDVDDNDAAEEEEEEEEEEEDEEIEEEIDEDPRSPIDELKSFDWKAMNDEFADFMGSDSEAADSDDESAASTSASVAGEQPTDPAPSNGKRKHDDTESNLAKRQRLAKDRGSSKLSSVSNTFIEDEHDERREASLPLRELLASSKTPEELEADVDADLWAELDEQLAEKG